MLSTFKRSTTSHSTLKSDCAERRLSDIVERHYFLTRLRTEKDRSPLQLVTTRIKNKSKGISTFGKLSDILLSMFIPYSHMDVVSVSFFLRRHSFTCARN